MAGPSSTIESWSACSPAPNAATSSPFSLINLGKHDEVSGDTPIIGLATPKTKGTCCMHFHFLLFLAASMLFILPPFVLKCRSF